MELWFTEEHTPTVRFSIKVKEQILSKKSPFQQIDVFDSDEFGRFFTLDGLIMVTEKDEFIYHDMIVHVPMATNPGASVEVEGDSLHIRGGKRLSGGEADSLGDHRLAMSLAVASLICDSPVRLSRPESVAKSAPRFWDEFRGLGGNVA